MKKKYLGMALIAAMSMSILAGCSTRGREEVKPQVTSEETKEESTTEVKEETSTETGKGFGKDATIGVSLPWLGTQNWKEAKETFKLQLEEAGYQCIIQEADNKVPQQQQQIEAMIENGAKVIVVGPVDGTQLGTVLEKAKEAGVYVIGYDRLIENTSGIDAVVQFGSVKTGELQAEALLEGLKKLKGEGPYNIELFAGGPADPNAPNFFKGAMKVLQPLIDDNTLVLVSGQKDFTQCATPDWDNAKAQSRMDSLLAGFYSDKKIDGVLSPNDGIARAIITSCEIAGQDIPVVSGLDAENESVKWIWEGKQYSTVAKPTDVLVGKTVELIQALQEGKDLPEADEKVNNGKIDVGVYELPPTVVTKDNAKEVFANDASRMELLK